MITHTDLSSEISQNSTLTFTFGDNRPIAADVVMRASKISGLSRISEDNDQSG